MDPGSDHILLCRLPGRTQRSGPQRWAVLLTYLIAGKPVDRRGYQNEILEVYD
jgi:hypothetical protein